jgi:hypothetical protein
MRPASRHALLERLKRAAPRRGARVGWVVALVAGAAIGIVFFIGGPAESPRATAPQERGEPLLDPVLALPFGEGAAATPSAAPAVEASRAVDALRVAYRSSGDRLALYRQWRLRPEVDARYLAYRAARDCELLLAGGVLAELDAISERRGERERQMAAAAARCRGFLGEPAPLDEQQRLLEETAAAGHPAAQIALATETFAQHPVAETMAVLRRSLASGDPLAFDEARVLLAMSRHQLEIAGVAPTATVDARNTDARVVAIDLVGCRLGNPCGPSRGAVAIECGDNAPCLRDAEEWVVQMADLGDEERRAALGLADRILAAFRRGAIDEIVRAPSNPQSTH